MKLITGLLAFFTLSLVGCGHMHKHGKGEACEKNCKAEGHDMKKSDCKDKGGCSAMMGEGAAAKATVKALGKSKVNGEVQLSQLGEEVVFKTTFTGLKANSTHGFHVHEKGDCSAADGSSAGGHFNPTKMNHGGPMDADKHTGDLGNLVADAKGSVTSETKVTGKLSDFLGRSFVVHANADDFKTQPSGAAGDRIACGVVGSN